MSYGHFSLEGIFFLSFTNNTRASFYKGEKTMRATGIVRRIDDLGRIVVPKEIRRTLRIREGDPLQTTSTVSSTERGYLALCGLANLLNQR